MLEPFPPGSGITSQGSYSFRGYSSQIQHIRAGNDSVDSLERRTADHYIAKGWRRRSDDGQTIQLLAGDWTLRVSGQKDYSYRVHPKDLDVILELSTFDAGCDEKW